jgi:general secretion pathway protein H
LLETVCALAIIALLAAIVVPAFPRVTSKTRLEAYAVETAAILKADHNAAVRRRVLVATQVSAGTREIRSGSTGRTLRLPNDVALEALLASNCGDRRTGATIDFLSSGMSCGGVLALSRAGIRYEVRVNWLTGGVEIVPRQAS